MRNEINFAVLQNEKQLREGKELKNKKKKRLQDWLSFMMKIIL